MNGWLLLDASKPLRYRKEVLPIGKWEKLDASGNGIKFEITPKFQDHLVLSVQQLRANGIKIPYTKSHEDWDKPGNNYGEVVGAAVQANKQGIPTFCVDVEFSSEDSKAEALKSDSSVGIPDRFFDGAGREYRYPLRHVAATNAPVIPGLGDWQAIAAAFQLPIEQVKKMSAPTLAITDTLAKTLDLSIDDLGKLDAAGQTAAIESAVGKLREGLNIEAGCDTSGMTPEEIAAAKKKKKDDLNMSNAPSPLVVKVVRDNRHLHLSGLVRDHKIDLPTMKSLEQMYATDTAIGLELSNGGDGSSFDKLIDVLKKNNPLSANGRSATGEGVELSHDLTDDGLIKNAKARREAAKA